MSGAFPDREKAFEEKWAHDEELRFRVLARRNHHLGLWAAGEMGRTGAEADAYSKTVVAAELSRGGDEAVFAKIRADFDAAGIARTDHLIRTKMDDLLAVAKDEILKAG
jgi:hypothetical protein